MSTKISAIVITKNNEDKIEECLASLAWADEIVVVDDFSDDSTPEICKKYGTKFFQHIFEGFQEQKAHATALTSHSWVLHLDADERVSEGMREDILRLKEEDFTNFSCFEFRRKTFFWGKWIAHSSLYPDYKPRLFHKEKGEWGGINPHDKFITRGLTKKLEGEILHMQDWDLPTYLSRTIRYSTISAEEYYRRGRRATWHHVTVRPLYTFLYRYFIRLGFLDGVQGFIISLMGSLATFIKYARLLEIQRFPPKEDSQSQINHNKRTCE